MPDSFEVNTLDRESYETVRMVVEIRRRVSDGAIFTLHRPMTPGDQRRMNKWEHRGLPQVSRALVIECVRREASNILEEGNWSPDRLMEEVESRVQKSVKSVIKGAVESVLRTRNKIK